VSCIICEGNAWTKLDRRVTPLWQISVMNGTTAWV